MFKHASLKTKILAILGFAVINVGSVGAISHHYLTSVTQAYGHLAETNMPALYEINEARNAQRDVVILVTNIAASDHAVSDIEKTRADFSLAIEKYEKATSQYHLIQALPEEVEIRAGVDKGWEEFVGASKKLVALADSNVPNDVLARTQIAKHELADGRKHFRDSFAKLTDFHEEEAKKWNVIAKDSAGFAKSVLLWATIIGSIFVLAIGLQVTQSLVKKLNEITGKISHVSEEALQATQEVSSASDQLSNSSGQQASSIQQTASAMEEISSMVGKNAASAESTRDISVDSQQKVGDGQRVVMQMVGAIENISSSNQQIAKQIELSNKEMTDITNVIAEIETKTKVINDIVFQTKLLSFNASVEAARAGEYGKGFAVVAEEVGNLAQMSGAASKSISDILRDSTIRVKDIVDRSSVQIGALMADNKIKITKGVETVEECRKVLDTLVDNVNRVTEMASGIADASREQSQGVNEVNSAVTRFGSLVDETNSSSKSLSEASRTLLTQTETMNNVVDELSAVVSGGGTKSAHHTKAA